MESNSNFEAEERKIGSAAARALGASLRSEIKKKFDRRTGLLDKTSVSARYKDGNLDRLVINMPKYSFTTHYGSDKKGVTKETTRKAADVRGFVRHIKNSVVDHPVRAYTRKGGPVKAHTKGIDYKATNHIALAFKNTNALQVLASQLGSSRALKITNAFDF